MKKYEGLDGDNDVKIRLLSHVGAFVSSNSKRIMNNFIREINSFYKNSKFDTDADSLLMEIKLGCVGQSYFCWI